MVYKAHFLMWLYCCCCFLYIVLFLFIKVHLWYDTKYIVMMELSNNANDNWKNIRFMFIWFMFIWFMFIWFSLTVPFLLWEESVGYFCWLYGYTYLHYLIKQLVTFYMTKANMPCRYKIPTMLWFKYKPVVILHFKEHALLWNIKVHYKWWLLLWSVNIMDILY